MISDINRVTDASSPIRIGARNTLSDQRLDKTTFKNSRLLNIYRLRFVRWLISYSFRSNERNNNKILRSGISTAKTNSYILYGTFERAQ